MAEATTCEPYLVGQTKLGFCCLPLLRWQGWTINLLVYFYLAGSAEELSAKRQWVHSFLWQRPTRRRSERGLRHQTLHRAGNVASQFFVSNGKFYHRVLIKTDARTPWGNSTSSHFFIELQIWHWNEMFWYIANVHKMTFL